MFQIKYLSLLLVLLCSVSLWSCSDDDGPQSPTFGQVVISPERDVYHVGDVVTCSIVRTSEGSTADLREASYWWYASWWFSDPELKADFQDFDAETATCTSAPITLTQPGEVTLYFFGRIEYPNFDWRKVEIGKTITVVE